MGYPGGWGSAGPPQKLPAPPAGAGAPPLVKGAASDLADAATTPSPFVPGPPAQGRFAGAANAITDRALAKEYGDVPLGDVYDGDPIMAEIEARQAADPIPAGAAETAANQAAPRRPAAVGAPRGYMPPGPQFESLQDYDEQLGKLEADFNARRHRVLEGPGDSRLKAQTLAQMQQEYTAARQGVLDKRQVFADSSEGLGDQMLGLSQEGQRAKIEHARDLAGIERDTAAQRGELAAQRHERAQAQGQAEQRERAGLQREVAAAEGAYRRGMAEYNAMADDPEGGALSTGQSIVGGLGLVLGAIATGLTGKNYAADVNAVLEKGVDRKMRQYQQRMQNKRAAVGDQRDLISVVRAQYQDAEQGWAAARLALKEQAIAEVEQLRTTAAGKRAGATFEQNVEQLKRSTEFDKAQLQKVTVDRYNVKREMHRRAVAGAQAAAAQKRREAAMRAAGMRKGTGKEFFLYDPRTGAPAFVLPGDVKGERADKLREEYGSVANKAAKADRLAQLARRSMADPKAQFEFDQGLMNLLLPVKNEITGAAASEKEMEGIRTMFVGDGSVTKSRALNQAAPAILRWAQGETEKVETMRRAHGAKPVQVLTAPNGDTYLLEGQTPQGGTAKLRDE